MLPKKVLNMFSKAAYITPSLIMLYRTTMKKVSILEYSYGPTNRMYAGNIQVYTKNN